MSEKPILRSVALAGACLALTFALLSCGGTKEGGPPPPDKAGPDVRVAGPPGVTLDKAAGKAAGIETQVVAASSRKPQVQAFGEVLSPEPLAEQRTRLASAAADLAAAQAAQDAARKEFERVSALHADSRQASEKALDTAKADLASADALAQSRAAALAVEKGRAETQWGRELAAILEEGGARYARIADRKALIVRISLRPGQEIPAPPQTAMVTASRNQYVPASLVGASSQADPRFQGRSLFYELASPAATILPGMTLEARLSSGQARPGVLVPASAVVWLNGRACVYREDSPGKYARLVLPDAEPSEDGSWFAPSGLAAGSAVVVQGAQTLLSQEFAGQIQGEE